MKINVNGEIFSKERAKISALDLGLLYGYGLFETMRAYHGKIFRLRKHMDRLFESSAIINMSINQTPDELISSIYSTLKANGLEDAYVRLSVTAGSGKPRLQLSDDLTSCFTIIVDELPNLEQKYKTGVRAIISQERVNNHSKLSRVKSLNFLANAIARQGAIEEGVDDAILLNCDGFVTEASTSNLFIVTDERLLTPPESSGILAGVTRDAVINGLGADVIETDITVKDLMGATECFLTNTISEVMSVIEVDGEKIGTGRPGELAKELHKKYKKIVRNELGIK